MRRHEVGRRAESVLVSYLGQSLIESAQTVPVQYLPIWPHLTSLPLSVKHEHAAPFAQLPFAPRSRLCLP